MKIQKYFFFLSIACIFTSLFSCNSSVGGPKETDEDIALQTVVEFLDSTMAVSDMKSGIAYNHQRAQELYPTAAPWFFTKKGIADFKNASVDREGDKFIVSNSKDCFFYVEKKDDKFIITDSKNILDIEFCIHHELRPIFLDTGVLNSIQEETDQARLKIINELVNSDFVDYLKNKYQDALSGYSKTISVKKQTVGRFYRVDVLFESGYNQALDVIVTVFNNMGKQVGQKTKSVGSLAKGERESVMVAFKNDVIGQVGKIDVTYRPSGIWSDTDLLQNFAPLSTTDYQEYLKSKK